jgi:hypothetical protein
MLRGLIVLLLLSTSADASPPSGYACSPGSTNKGAGCTCPAKHREKRDAENIALCAAAPTANAAQQLKALLAKPNLVAAIELAKKFDFDEKTLKDTAMAFVKWVAPVRDQIALLASRGQCSAVSKQLDGVNQWRTLFVTMTGRSWSRNEYKDDMMNAFTDKLDEVLAPLTNNLKACIDTASKDDGTAQIKAAYEAAKEPVRKCFEGLPDPKTPAKLRVVVDADGVVAETRLEAVWPDLDLKLTNLRLELVRLDEIGLREQCFQKAAGGWKFKANARGFAANIPISK